MAPPKSFCSAAEASSGTCFSLYLECAEPSCQQMPPIWMASAPRRKPGFPSAGNARRDQQHHAQKPDRNADPALQRDPFPLRPEQLDDRHPERRRGHQQRGDAARHVLLGPDHGQIADADEQEADQRQVGQRPAVIRNPFAAQAGDRQHDHAGDHETQSGQQQRRHRLQGDGDAEIGRAPDHANRGEGDVRPGAFTLHGSLPGRSRRPSHNASA